MRGPGGDSECIFRRFGEGSSGTEGEVFGDAAALCINFMVNRREDNDFGALLGELVADMAGIDIGAPGVELRSRRMEIFLLCR
jgi:hypothetical protein